MVDKIPNLIDLTKAFPRRYARRIVVSSEFAYQAEPLEIDQLMWFAIIQNDAQQLTMALKHGASPNLIDIYQERDIAMLGYAIYNGDPNQVRLLLDAGADPNYFRAEYNSYFTRKANEERSGGTRADYIHPHTLAKLMGRERCAKLLEDHPDYIPNDKELEKLKQIGKIDAPKKLTPERKLFGEMGLLEKIQYSYNFGKGKKAFVMHHEVIGAIGYPRS